MHQRILPLGAPATRRAAGLGAVCGAICFLATGTPRLEAGWGNAGPGIVHVPIAAEGAVPLSGRYGGYIGVPDALDDPPPAEEIAELRKHPPFEGKSDAEITEKMRAIREEVFDAIALIHKLDLPGYLEHHIATCLEHRFLMRELCIEFSTRSIGGVIQGSELGSPPEAVAGTIYSCGKSAVAIKIYPCESGPDYAVDFVKMMATLLHEGLHLTQRWPTGIRQRLQRNAADLQKRIDWQCNEIAASELEGDLLSDVFTMFTGIERDGKIPPDDPERFTLSPAARCIGESFLASVPAADVMTEAEKITGALAGRSVEVRNTQRCRETIKAALENLKTAVDSGNQGAMQTAEAEYRAVLQQNGWYSHLGNQVFNGVFSLDLIAGGEMPTAIRQFTPEGEEISFQLDGWTSISDAAAREDGILVGVDDGIAGNGGILRIMANPTTGLLDPGSTETLASGPEFSGGVGLAYSEGRDDAFVLSRENGMLHTISAPFGPTFQVMPVTGTVGTDQLDPLVHVFTSGEPDDPFIHILSDRDTPIDPNTGVLQVDLGPDGDEVFGTGLLRPFQHFGPGPSITRQPEAGDRFVRVFGAGETGITVQNLPPGGGELVIGFTTTEPNGDGVVPLFQPLPEGGHLQVIDAHGRRSNPIPTADSFTPPRNPPIFSPAAQNAPGGGTDLHVMYLGERDQLVDLFASDGPDGPFLQPIGQTRTDGFGGLSFANRFPGDSGFIHAQDVGSAPLDIAPDFTPRLLAPGVRTMGCLWALFEGDVSIIPKNDLRAEVLSAPPGMSGDPAIDDQWFLIDPNTGNYHITALTPPTGSSQFSISVQLRSTDGSIIHGPFDIPFEASFPKLANPVAIDGFYRIPCLVLSGEHFPMFQFRLVAGHSLNVPEPHWHWFPGFGVSSLENPDVAVSDPNPPNEGYGRWVDVPQTVEIVPDDELRAFAEIWNNRIGN